MISWHEDDNNHLIEDKRNSKSAERHKIPPVRLTLWYIMVTMCYFVWPLAFQLWSVRQSARQASSQKVDFWLSKILYPAACKCFLALNDVFDFE